MILQYLSILQYTYNILVYTFFLGCFEIGLLWRVVFPPDGKAHLIQVDIVVSCDGGEDWEKPSVDVEVTAEACCGVPLAEDVILRTPALH